MASAFGPRNERAISANLVMLDRLTTRNDRGIEHSLILYLTRDLIRLLDDPVDCRAGRSLGLLAEFCEHFVEALDLFVGFFQMSLEAGYQIAIGRFFDHLRKCLGDLMLCVIDVLQLMQEQVFHCFDVFAENAHESLLYDGH